MTRSRSAQPDTATPLVTVIVCTRDRPNGLRRALQSVQRQELSGHRLAVEVVVVDDGSTPPAAPEPGERFPVRIVRIAAGRPGAARKAGLAAARGAVIAWCDDDDTWAPDHLAMIVPPLLAPDPPALVAAYDGDPREAPASTVAVRTAVAHDTGGFDPGLDAFEDWDLWHRIGRSYPVRAVPAGTVALGPPAQRDPLADPAAWQRVEADEIRFRQRQRRNARARSYASQLPFNPVFWQRGERRLLFQAMPDPARSFGFVARTLMEGLEARGVDVVVGPFRERNAPAGCERFWRPLWREGHLGFIIDYLVGPSALGCERVIYYATFESTIVPRELVQEVNEHVSLLLVPCRWNLDLYAKRGVTVPIRLLPHGVDPASFPYLDRPERDIFTVGTFGDLSRRKGTDLLLRAFLAEFRPEEPVRLLVKRTYGDEEHEIGWPPDLDSRRVEVRTGFLDQPALLAFLRELDLFVLPSRGEGFGLCGLEAMATGLPLIATNWSGPADYLDPADGLPLDYRMTDADGDLVSHTRYFGRWAEPDEAHLRSLMRWTYEHRAEAASMGRLASARVHRNWTWASVLDRLESILGAVAAGTTPS